MREEFKAAVLKIKEDLADIAMAIAPLGVTEEGKQAKPPDPQYMYWRIHHSLVHLCMNLSFAAKYGKLVAVGEYVDTFSLVTEPYKRRAGENENLERLFSLQQQLQDTVARETEYAQAGAEPV